MDALSGKVHCYDEQKAWSAKQTDLSTKKKCYAQVRNFGYGGKTCLDSPARKNDLHKAVGLYPCHGQGGNQVSLLCEHVGLTHARPSDLS